MQFTTILEICVLAFVTFALLYRFAAKNVSIGLRVLVYLSWFLSFSVVILVPMDLQNVSIVIPMTILGPPVGGSGE